MATNISFTPGDDIIVPTGSPSEPGNTFLGGAGNDTYIISNLVGANTIVNILDTKGTNTIQFLDNLTIASSLFTNDAVELTLSNNAKVRVTNIGTNFNFQLGANLLVNDTAPDQTFVQFANSLGVASLPAPGQAPVPGSNNFVVGAPPPSPVTKITAGGDFSATSGVDIFLYEFTIVNGRATTPASGGAARITGFNPAQDILRFDGPSPLTEAQFLATPGVLVSGNPFGTPNTTIFFDPNALATIGSVTVFGINDPTFTTLNVEIV
jgi:hypothetical protein